VFHFCFYFFSSENDTSRGLTPTASSWLLWLLDLTEGDCLEVFLCCRDILGEYVLFCFFRKLSCFIYCDIFSFFNFFLNNSETLLNFFEGSSCFGYTRRCFYCSLHLVYRFDAVWFRCSFRRLFRRSWWIFVVLFLLFIFMVVLILVVVCVLDIFHFVNSDVET